MEEKQNRRTAVIGGLTLAALAISVMLAVRARGRVDVPVVIVAPAGTAVELDGAEPRELPRPPHSANTLASYYFITTAGDHEVRFREPGRALRSQTVSVPASSLPVIYTLLRDTLREMKERAQ